MLAASSRINARCVCVRLTRGTSGFPMQRDASRAPPTTAMKCPGSGRPRLVRGCQGQRRGVANQAVDRQCPCVGIDLRNAQLREDEEAFDRRHCGREHVRLERNTAERRIRIEYRMRWRRPTGKKCHADATGPRISEFPTAQLLAYQVWPNRRKARLVRLSIRPGAWS